VRPLAEQPGLPWTLPILGDAEALKNRAATAQAAVPCRANPSCQRDSACRLAAHSHHIGTFPASTRARQKVSARAGRSSID
jgi:hypothetical protein